jgi:heme/copper-type cytochrome/quinol oxidase subunit 2
MFLAILICVALVFVLTVVAIIMTLNKRSKGAANDSETPIYESRQKLDFRMIWMAILSVVLLLTIVCVTWQIGQLNQTLKSIDGKLSVLDNNLSGTNVTLSDMDKNLDFIFQVLQRN